MAQRVRIKLGEEWVEGEELAFEPLKESWNEYRCEDGSYVKIKLVVAKVTRLDKQNAAGEPIYVVNSSSVVAATPPADRKS
ncbi:MAG: hypothetical protein HY359_14335 [Candidatus Rokubacteria bacterium]|nr:hypothetical protein [Candidatus Rokubacteria bacterium]